MDRSCTRVPSSARTHQPAWERPDGNGNAVRPLPRHGASARFRSRSFGRGVRWTIVHRRHLSQSAGGGQQPWRRQVSFSLTLSLSLFLSVVLSLPAAHAQTPLTHSLTLVGLTISHHQETWSSVQLAAPTHSHCGGRFSAKANPMGAAARQFHRQPRYSVAQPGPWAAAQSLASLAAEAC